jgi:hypothetical protein
MNEKKIYGRWFIWEEFAGIPMIAYHWIKGDRIKKLLSERIDKARKNGEQVELTEKIKQEFLIEYERLDNFFSYHFKEIDKSRNHNFEDKINYCLKQYKKESSKQLTSSNLMKLQGNFINGAEITLFYYFALKQKVTEDIRISDIILGENTSKILLSFLKDKKFIDENNNFIADKKSSFIRIHRFLKDNHIINPDFEDTTIIKAMENEYNTIFDKGTFSRAIKVKSNDFEENIYKELSQLLNIRN